MKHIKAKINKWIKLENNRKGKKPKRESWEKEFENGLLFFLKLNELTMSYDCTSKDTRNNVGNIVATELVQL